MLRFWRYRELGLLWAGQATSDLGTSLLFFALLMAIFDRTGSASLTTWVFLAGVAPPALLSGRAGRLADRVERRRLLVIADSFRVVLTLPLLSETVLDTPWALCGTFAAQATVSTVFRPAYQAFIPATVPVDKLPDANALMFVTSTVLTLSAPFAGAVLYGVIGLRGLVVLDALSFVVSVVTLLAMRARSQPGRDAAAGGEAAPAPATSAALLRRFPVVVAVMAVSGGVLVADALLGPTFVPFLRGELGASNPQVGLAMTAVGVGGIAGGLLAAPVVRTLGSRRTIVVSLGAAALLFLAYALAPSLAFAFGVLALFGVISPLGQVAEQTLFQTEIPDALRGSVFGLYRQFGAVIRLGAGLALASVVDAVGLRHMLVAGSVLAVGVTTAGGLRLWRSAADPGAARPAAVQEAGGV